MKTGGGESLQFFTVDDVKIDCVTYPYKWLRPAVVSDGIRLADIPDIAAMKLAAATNRGTRKDFVDVYFLLQKYSLRQMLDWYVEKYPDGNEYLDGWYGDGHQRWSLFLSLVCKSAAEFVGIVASLGITR